MSIITQITRELEERTMAAKIGSAYDDARISYRLDSNQVSSDDEFHQIIGDFYNHMHSKCVSKGSPLAQHEATGKAISIIEESLHRDGGNIRTAFQNAQGGINGGMMQLLDIISGTMRTEAYRLYTDHVLRTYISPMEWEPKVDAIRSLLEHYKHDLPSDIDIQHPEKYANDYKRLIQGLVYSINKTASEFRRY